MCGTTRLDRIESVSATSMDIVDYSTGRRNWYEPPGPYEHDLLCSEGTCDEVLMEGWTFEEAWLRFTSPVPKIALCRNQHLTVLPCNLTTDEPGLMVPDRN